MGKVAVIGMVGNSAFLSVDHFHAEGETLSADAIHFEPGGKGFNQAVAAARHGAQVAFLGAVGAQYGREIEEFLTNDRITPVLPQKDGATAFAAILTDANGANRVTVYQGVRLETADVEAFREHIATADILLLNNEVPQQVNARAIEIAKAHNTYVILNPAPACPLSDYILDNTDLFTPNEHEYLSLPDRKNAIVTLGSKGCLWKAADRTFPSVPIRDVVDTTGAGDTFNGVLAAHLAAGASVEESIPSAVAASGVSVTKKFAATGIPTAAEVSAYLQSTGELKSL